MSILDTGEVCMELLKCHGGQERVKEVLQISCDGSMVSPLLCCFWVTRIHSKRLLTKQHQFYCRQVTIYQPNGGKGFPVLDCPPALPEDILICSYEDLPGRKVERTQSHPFNKRFKVLRFWSCLRKILEEVSVCVQVCAASEIQDSQSDPLHQIC